MNSQGKYSIIRSYLICAHGIRLYLFTLIFYLNIIDNVNRVSPKKARFKNENIPERASR